MITVLNPNDTLYRVHISVDTVAAATGYMLIDLSDTTNWPHINTNRILLRRLMFNFNPTAAYRGDIQLGFLANVDATNGDLQVQWTFHSDQSSSSLIDQRELPENCDADSNLWHGPTTLNDTTWQTDTNLIGPAGGAAAHPAGNGDFVMKINQTAGAIDGAITIMYTTV